MIVKVKGFESFMYREIYKILEWKDGCIYKTKSIGYLPKDIAETLDKSLYTNSSIRTELTIKKEFEIDLLLELTIDN